MINEDLEVKTKQRVIERKEFTSQKGSDIEREAELESWKDGMAALVHNINPDAKAAFVFSIAEPKVTMLVFRTSEDMFEELQLIGESLEDSGMFVDVRFME
jgi:hypothetical protein